MNRKQGKTSTRKLALSSVFVFKERERERGREMMN
jgi:hypothetical protein